MIPHVLHVTPGGKPSCQTTDWKHVAYVSQPEEGGFHTRCQLFLLHFTFLWSSLSTSLTERDDCCFLGVCMCLHFVATLLSGIPRLLFSLWRELCVCVCGGGKGGERESSRLCLAGGSFPPSSCPSVGAKAPPARGSCLSFRGISQLHWSRTLCNTKTLQNNGNPSPKDFFFRFWLTVHYHGVS